MIKIGDTVVPKRCSTEYQTANKMTVKYIKMSRFNTICDGENMVGKYASASENGWSWFPLNTLEKWEETDGHECDCHVSGFTVSHKKSCGHYE